MLKVLNIQFICFNFSNVNIHSNIVLISSEKMKEKIMDTQGHDIPFFTLLPEIWQLFQIKYFHIFSKCLLLSRWNQINTLLLIIYVWRKSLEMSDIYVWCFNMAEIPILSKDKGLSDLTLAVFQMHIYLFLKICNI